MKNILLAAALLSISATAQAQELTHTYGDLRTALENSMAQAMPPYGKIDRDQPVQAASAQPDAAEQGAAATAHQPTQSTAMNDGR